MLTVAALLAFLQHGYCSIWVIMIVLSREFVVTSLRMVALTQNIVIAAGILGKIKTACQMVFTVIVMILMQFGLPESFPVSVATVSNILMWIVAILTVASGIKYLVDGFKMIDFDS